MAVRFPSRNRHIMLYGVALALLLFLLKWLEWRFIIFDHAIEIYSGALALIFTALGIWLALKLARPKVGPGTAVGPVGSGGPVSSGASVGSGGRVGSATPMGSAVADGSDGPVAPVGAVGPDGATGVDDCGLSLRECEVLQLMAEGLSNQEIANRLFVSLNTIKTHGSRIFEKLDVRRRTQAIEKAKRLNIIR